jgi:hypothetical protein
LAFSIVPLGRFPTSQTEGSARHVSQLCSGPASFVVARDWSDRGRRTGPRRWQKAWRSPTEGAERAGVSSSWRRAASLLTSLQSLGRAGAITTSDRDERDSQTGSWREEDGPLASKLQWRPGVPEVVPERESDQPRYASSLTLSCAHWLVTGGCSHSTNHHSIARCPRHPKESRPPHSNREPQRPPTVSMHQQQRRPSRRLPA